MAGEEKLFQPDSKFIEEYFNPRLIDIGKRRKEWNRLLNAYFPNLPCQSFEQFIMSSPPVDAVPVADIEAWLYEIAMNNTGNPLGGACEEIIRRLDGLRQFSRERGNKDA